MRRMQATLVFVALIFLAACGSDDSQTSGSSGENGGSTSNGQQENGGQGSSGDAAGEEQYAADQYNLTEDGAADDQYQDVAIEDLPFPTPPGAEVVVAGQSQEEAYAAVINVSSGQEAYDFYLEALPDAGFEIVSDSREGQNEQDGEEDQSGEGNGEAPPFSATLTVQSDEYAGSLRLDEERAVVGISSAAFEDAAEAPTEEEAPSQE